MEKKHAIDLNMLENQIKNSEIKTYFIKYTAGETLSGHRVVKVVGGKAYYLNAAVENDIGKQIGITNNAALVDDVVNVITTGVVNNAGWGLTPDDVYFVTGLGIITNVVPTSGIFMRVGVAIDANNLKLEFSEPVML